MSRARRSGESSWGFQIAPVLLKRAERKRSEVAVWSEKVRSPTCDSCFSNDAKDLFLHLGVVAELFPGALHLHLLCQGH